MKNSRQHSTQEDRELTAFLQRHIDALLSSNSEPRPPCFHCGSVHVGIQGYRNALSGQRIPRFLCRTCNREFTRLHGTPLYGRHAQKMEALIPLLSQPISRAEVTAMLGIASMNIATKVKELRAWLLELDSTGKWETRVRLGGLPTAILPAQWQFEEAGAREDFELTRRLTAEFDEIHSTTGRAPACPYCASLKTYEQNRLPSQQFPAFRCTKCRKVFNRRTGTPFTLVRVKSLPRVRALIRYLSLPLPYSQLSEVFGVMDEQIMSWRELFEQVANRLQPDGSLSARIKLGVTPGPKTPCLFCARVGMARPFESRVWNCAGCGRLFSMRRVVVERSGRLEILNVHPDEAPDDALLDA
ncbi:hypothetical protein DM39_3517 [Burkholderia cenocepacia]|uniref:DUF746 domain-containing protein n=1 Tax=Burkholderia cenocepacia TaxID=95486 RepID=A0AAN0VPZ7_9BURK|nr:hypothetical protein DM39_3517 [Burkholderia cenocepacia]